jgi:hypothetical protein
MKRYIMHLCSTQLDQNKVLRTSFSRVLNIQGVSKILRQKSTASSLHQKKKTIHINLYNGNEWVLIYFKYHIQT